MVVKFYQIAFVVLPMLLGVAGCKRRELNNASVKDVGVSDGGGILMNDGCKQQRVLASVEEGKYAIPDDWYLVEQNSTCEMEVTTTEGFGLRVNGVRWLTSRGAMGKVSSLEIRINDQVYGLEAFQHNTQFFEVKPTPGRSKLRISVGSIKDNSANDLVKNRIQFILYAPGITVQTSAQYPKSAGSRDICGEGISNDATVRVQHCQGGDRSIDKCGECVSKCAGEVAVSPFKRCLQPVDDTIYRDSSIRECGDGGRFKDATVMVRKCQGNDNSSEKCTYCLKTCVGEKYGTSTVKRCLPQP
jgi:hypothetical protein